MWNSFRQDPDCYVSDGYWKSVVSVCYSLRVWTVNTLWPCWWKSDHIQNSGLKHKFHIVSYQFSQALSSEHSEHYVPVSVLPGDVMWFMNSGATSVFHDSHTLTGKGLRHNILFTTNHNHAKARSVSWMCTQNSIKTLIKHFHWSRHNTWSKRERKKCKSSKYWNLYFTCWTWNICRKQTDFKNTIYLLCQEFPESSTIVRQHVITSSCQLTRNSSACPWHDTIML